VILDHTYYLGESISTKIRQYVRLEFSTLKKVLTKYTYNDTSQIAFFGRNLILNEIA